MESKGVRQRIKTDEAFGLFPQIPTANCARYTKYQWEVELYFILCSLLHQIISYFPVCCLLIVGVSVGRGKTRKQNGTDRRNRNGGTGKAETEKRVKRGKEGKTRKRG
jgi:hypothetical protein